MQLRVVLSQHPAAGGGDTSRATADFRKGVLEVTMPVTSTAKPKSRQIEVKEVK